MQNHHQPNQEPSPISRKPPRPPPISVSLSQPSDPDTPPTRSDPEPRSADPNSPEEKQPVPLSPTSKNGGAIVAIEKYYSPLTSPLPLTPPNDTATTHNVVPPHHQIVKFKGKEDEPPPSGVVYAGGGEGLGKQKKRKVRFGYGGRVDDTPRPSKKEDVVNKVALGIRVFELAFCLVSFSVMATDKTQGWSGDSFSRYKEYRFCLTVNIIGFVYAGLQAFDLAYHSATGKQVVNLRLHYRFDFIMDQIMAYLLISASSAAATRVVDWELNWGKDEFTEKVSASVSMAFLAFLTFAMSSLISGYNLCNRDVS